MFLPYYLSSCGLFLSIYKKLFIDTFVIFYNLWGEKVLHNSRDNLVRLTECPKRAIIACPWGFVASQANPKWLSNSVFKRIRIFHLMKNWFFFFTLLSRQQSNAKIKGILSMRNSVLWLVALCLVPVSTTVQFLQVEGSSLNGYTLQRIHVWNNLYCHN